jgi:hypothetical protein
LQRSIVKGYGKASGAPASASAGMGEEERGEGCGKKFTIADPMAMAASAPTGDSNNKDMYSPSLVVEGCAVVGRDDEE